ncbi:MAG: hypothetical protein J5820_02055 [Rhodocyclaceae bacterium]|nr:hypothetical protein [Rhodocyclaceae bacterium]
MKVLTSFTRALLIAATACTLAACGGGDGDNPPEPQPTPSPEANKYVGTWLEEGWSGCEESDFRLASTGQRLFERYTLELIAAGGRNLQTRQVVTIYEDARCTVRVGVKEENGSLRYRGEGVRTLNKRQVGVDLYIYHWDRGVLRNEQTGEEAAMNTDYRTDRDLQVAGFLIYASDVDDNLLPPYPLDQYTDLYVEGNRLYFFDEGDSDDYGEFFRR